LVAGPERPLLAKGTFGRPRRRINGRRGGRGWKACGLWLQAGFAGGEPTRWGTGGIRL